jgi:hypothetical protein
MAEAGVCRSIYNLSFQLGFVADRVGWAVQGYGSEDEVDDAAMSLVVDTMTAALEGRNGEYSTSMHRQVGELELEKAITTSLEDEDNETATAPKHRASRTSQAEALREKITTFMSAHSTLFQAGGSPVGKTTAYMQRKYALAAQSERAHAGSRLANMSEVQYERLMESSSRSANVSEDA